MQAILVDCAGRRGSQSLLPLPLLRRLVRATATQVTEFHIRTGEGDHLPGWDGINRNEQGHTPRIMNWGDNRHGRSGEAADSIT